MTARVGVLVLLASCVAEPAADPDTPVESDPAETTDDTVDTDPSWRSAHYPEDWAPGLPGPDGLSLPDFSYAGWRAGEPLPAVEGGVDVDAFGADPTGQTDSAAAVQAAIDSLPDGGVVRFGPGSYLLERSVVVGRSGVVLAGAGSAATFLHLVDDTAGFGEASIRFAGVPGDGGSWPIAEPWAQDGDQVVVASSEGLAVGDDVAVGWTITERFIEAWGMTGTWAVSAGQVRPFFRRVVTAIDGDRVTLDGPLPWVGDADDGLVLVEDGGYLHDVGVVGLSLSTEVESSVAWAANQHHALHLQRVADAWVQDVRSYAASGGEVHLQSGGILVEGSRRVTVADVHLGRAQNRGPGGNGYLFEIRSSNDVLVRDSLGEEGRHNFIVNWDFGTSGVVFLRTTSRGGRATTEAAGGVGFTGRSEFHHHLSIACLIDQSVTDDGWQAVNRHGESTGAGITATRSVFWNTSGTGLLRSFQGGDGWVIGTGPELVVQTDLATPDLLRGPVGTEPADGVEGIGEGATLVPVSLYEDQRRRRLAR